MDSAALLDLLGNDNRRRILRLLARKPCYVTEISEYLGVSPKAVIEHLEKLEEAGLVESRVDDRRRKYFHIARNVRLEVNVSPYGFGTKSAYAASKGLDVTRWRHLSIEVDDDAAATEDGRHSRDDPGPPGADGDGTRVDAGGSDDADDAAGNDAAASGLDAADADRATDATDADDVSALAGRLREFEELQNELSMAQRWVQGRITDLLDRITDAVEEDPGVDGRLYADLLRSLAGGERTTVELARAAEAPPEIVETALSSMAEAGIVERAGDAWRLSG